ncbi:MAG: exosortase [Sedimentisphaerales bacterium]|nr:exosortase [Sedimentisphaerales bacterium]
MVNAKAVILVGSRDFGRCPLASRLSTPLWPVVGKTVLERLLTHLANEGIRQAVVCSGEEGLALAESIRVDDRLEVEFLDETLPVGTAGCLRDAVRGEEDALLFVFSASVVSPPDIGVLIDAHNAGKSDLTVILNPEYDDSSPTGQATGIYVCESRVLEHIPEAGYVDIKEGLIPEMLRAGKTVHAATLPNHVGNFRDWQGYLYAIADYLERAPGCDADVQWRENSVSPDVRVAATATVDSSARIQGSVVIMDEATVSSGAVVLGPAVLGRRVSIGEDSVVVNSVIWDDAQIGPNCGVRRSVVDGHAVVPSDTLVEDKPVAFKPKSFLGRLFERAKNIIMGPVQALSSYVDGIGGAVPNWMHVPKEHILAYLAAVLLLGVFIWSYKRGLGDLWNLWHRSDEYSVGLIVPFLALYILWTRRHVIAKYPIKPSIWGFILFIGAQIIRFFGLFFMYSSAERFSIVFSIAAIVLLLFGWSLFRKVSPILLFLCLMLPPPNLIQSYTVLHLQRWATSSAVFCLEMIGCGVIQEGNTIHIGDTSVEVAYACNGLRMITAFFVISGLVVLMVNRVWWEKLIILISSLPIALLCNTVRLTVTALALTKLSDQFWDDVFHDFGGYAMMPLALAIVVGELWVLTRLTTLPVAEEAVIITRQKA